MMIYGALSQYSQGEKLEDRVFWGWEVEKLSRKTECTEAPAWRHYMQD